MEGVDGMSIGEEDREAMKAVDAEEIQIYKDIRLINIYEIQKRSLKPCGNAKLIDITEAHSITDDERNNYYKSLGLTTKNKEIAIMGRFLDEHPDIDWKKTPFFLYLGMKSPCSMPRRLPGIVNFYLRLDGTTPISRIRNSTFTQLQLIVELFSTYSGFRQQLCLAHLLYSKTKRMTDPSGLSNSTEAKIMHNLVLSYCERNTTTFIRSIQNPFGFGRGENLYLELLLETMLMERIYKRLKRDVQQRPLIFKV
ncbi:hypothetical protein MKW92_051064 [Papaver armeniacum]|nr:hypothetical protein MKW92_051064 [Papaver armeniacum]